ncbi:mannitol dehydrogenase family protein [Conexibacter sp. SYSU D00693]|uniref:mannitol dehydrogenase family protein n=1 Tax=Conexibacter sp. SYSU D00693 TaxID=2812560 RepID=UPI00196AF147|nr:mannitol dehydrogenase family protein [Conexibacter sp. SYSU D00693]
MPHSPTPQAPAGSTLADATLADLPSSIAVPTYDRSALTPSVVHLGVGGFHRAHQAVYLDDLAEQGISTDWGITGVSLRRPAMRDALVPQDGLYTVVERDERFDRPRVIGALQRCLFAGEDAEEVMAALTDRRTRLVTLTLTGGAYDAGEDDEDLDRPGTAFGWIAAALRRRRADGTPPFVVLSCDNVPENGAAARRATLEVARRHDADLAGWIAEAVRFPSSVVDRITPETTDDLRALLAERHGVVDQWPVATEPFRQWIVEDALGVDGPPLDQVGVQLVADVAPYERMKKRLLNGGHSALGYVGYLLGHRDTSGAMADPLVHDFLDRLMADEVAPLLPEVPGIDLDEYRRSLLRRFANPAVGDQLARLCGRGSTKVPSYLLPSIEEARERGRPHELLTLAVAAWVRYLRGTDLEGREIAIRDARLDELQPLAQEGGDDPAPLFERTDDVFGWLADDPMLVRSVERALRALERDGLRCTVEAYVRAEAGRVAA